MAAWVTGTANSLSQDLAHCITQLQEKLNLREKGTYVKGSS